MFNRLAVALWKITFVLKKIGKGSIEYNINLTSCGDIPRKSTKGEDRQKGEREKIDERRRFLKELRLVMRDYEICLSSKGKKKRKSSPNSSSNGEFAGVGTAAVCFSDQQMSCIGTSQKGSVMLFILLSWCQYTKYILLTNHCIKTSGHLCCRALFKQRSKQNWFLRMSTWQVMYIRIAGKPASWLRSIVLWIHCSHLPIFHTHQAMSCGGSSHAPGCWHPRSSCPLHYSFFTDVELW